MTTLNDGSPVSGPSEAESGIDLSGVTGLQAIVKKQTTSDVMESTDFRTGEDLRDFRGVVDAYDVRCDQEKRKNVFQNAMGYSTRRDRYQS